MWKDYDDKIHELFLNLGGIKEFPTVCPMCNKKATHIYICIFIMMKQGEEGRGFGAVNAIHFYIVLYMYPHIGKIVL